MYVPISKGIFSLKSTTLAGFDLTIHNLTSEDHVARAISEKMLNKISIAEKRFNRFFGIFTKKTRIRKNRYLKIPIWVNLGGSYNGIYWSILWPFGLFYGHLVCFTAIWSVLRPLVYFMVI
jgi:hypothetical protein